MLAVSKGGEICLLVYQRMLDLDTSVKFGEMIRKPLIALALCALVSGLSAGIASCG